METTNMLTKNHGITVLLCLAAAIPAGAQTITSVAGNTSWGLIYNVTVDAAGNIYTADNTKHYVYKVDTLGATTIIAGTGAAGFAGDGALATAAKLYNPTGVAVASDGTVYIADTSNDRIRKVAPNGIITTFAGGTQGFAGDGGPATAARLNGPISVALDAAGNLFFTDAYNYRVRKIATSGTITTVAGTGRCPFLSGDGGLATSADACPGWLALGSDGSIYFTDDGDGRFYGYSRIRKVATNGTISTVAGGDTSTFSGDGGPATAARLRSASGVTIDAGGNLFISDALDARIRKVDPSGLITTYVGTGSGGFAGDGGTAVKAQVNWPTGLRADSSGNLYFVDRNNYKVRKISPPPVPTIRTSNPALTSFGGAVGFSSNTYVEIYGANFSTASRLWAGADFNGSNAPTALDGIGVTVNGKPAFIYYVSPGQININTPEDTATGPVSIQVKTPLGLSNVVTANRARLSPTLQTVPQFNIGGKQYVVALTPDFVNYIGRPGMLQGVSFIAAKPGDTVSIYALGCGPTNPPTQAGVVAAQGSPIASSYQIKIGGVQATVPFAGMVGGSIGLYQFNVVIPAVAAGDQTIELTVDGISNGQNLVITIGS
jgi:uncharacterized protein (TIGR03437 family)